MPSEVAVREKTGPQVSSGIAIYVDNELPRKDVHSRTQYESYREIRKDPTIAFARWLMIAPLVKAGWSIEAADDAPRGAQELITNVFDELRVRLVKSSLEGCIDYGWQPYEKVWSVDDDGAQVIKKMKPLIQDFTDILVEEETGAFAGYRQTTLQGDFIDLEIDNVLHVNIDVEGTDWYGQSIMEIAKGPYDRYEAVDQASDRYDAKIAGTHLVVYYPVGSTTVEGVEKDNAEVARMIVSSFKASGAITVPLTMAPFTDSIDEGDQPTWKIELLTDSGGGASFHDRQKYLDALKVRSFGWPERAVLEGEFGTKAEAEAHSTFAITLQEHRYDMVVMHYNRYAVRAVMEMNYGPKERNKVWIEPTGLTDEEKSFFRQLYMQMLQSPDLGMVEGSTIDFEAVRQRIGVPTADPEQAALFTADEISQLASQGDEGIASALEKLGLGGMT